MLRYIEQNPQRARLVKAPEHYAYSSARSHIKGTKDKLLGENIIDAKEQSAYIEFIRASVSEKEANQIRRATQTGRPLGDAKFIKKIGGVLKAYFYEKCSQT